MPYHGQWCRRTFLKASLLTGLALFSGQTAWARELLDSGLPLGRLSLLNLHSGERLTATYRDRSGEYDLQALIYTLALHRWLRFRLGADYDYGRDFGGIRYLFCRGLDAARSDSPGIHAQRFGPELVHALDALFGHVEGVAA